MKATLFRVDEFKGEDGSNKTVSLCTNGRHVHYQVQTASLGGITGYVKVLPRSAVVRPCRGECRGSYDIRPDAIDCYRRNVSDVREADETMWERYAKEEERRFGVSLPTHGQLFHGWSDDHGCGGHTTCLGSLHACYSHEGSSGCYDRGISIEWCDRRCEKRRVVVPKEIERHCVGKLPPQPPRSHYAGW